MALMNSTTAGLKIASRSKTKYRGAVSYGNASRVVFYIESRRFLIRDSPRPATTYEQKTGGADGVKGA